jgi:hypothetical protein
MVRYKYLLLFFICYISFGPFYHIHVAIGCVLELCCFVIVLLVVVCDLCLFLRI